MFVNNEQKGSDEAPCLCHSGTFFPKTHHPRPEKISLDFVVNLDTQLTTLLVAIRACAQCSNDVQIIPLALKDILLLLKAEKQTYNSSKRTQTPENSCLSFVQ